jgi:hypothetical protein
VGREDSDVSEEVERILRAEGIEVLLSSDLNPVEGRFGTNVRARVAPPPGARRVYTGRPESVFVSPNLGRQAGQIAVSDRATFGGVSQFGFAGSATSL